MSATATAAPATASMLPAIDHAFLIHARNVDTYRVLEHKKTKRMAFKREMERIRHQGEDRPSLPPPNALPRGKVEPLRRNPQSSPIKSAVRGLDAPLPKVENLAPVSPLAAQMKLKILKDSSLSKIQASPLDPLNGGYGRREQYFKNLNKSRSIMKDATSRPANVTIARKKPNTKKFPETSSVKS